MISWTSCLFVPGFNPVDSSGLKVDWNQKWKDGRVECMWVSELGNQRIEVLLCNRTKNVQKNAIVQV